MPLGASYCNVKRLDTRRKISVCRALVLLDRSEGHHGALPRSGNHMEIKRVDVRSLYRKCDNGADVVFDVAPLWPNLQPEPLLDQLRHRK